LTFDIFLVILTSSNLLRLGNKKEKHVFFLYFAQLFVILPTGNLKHQNV